MTGIAAAGNERLPPVIVMRNAWNPLPNLEVIPATADQESILANLLELYAHDFSEFHELELGPDGRFGYPALPLYWRDPHRHPFLVRSEGHWVGFVFVVRGSPLSEDETIWDMAEFFVARRYRRHGVGTQVAQKIWQQFPGPWEVRVLASNRAAHSFWEQAIAVFTGKAISAVPLEKGGQCWRVFSFASNGVL
jgi:predicted acetyltransferase